LFTYYTTDKDKRMTSLGNSTMGQKITLVNNGKRKGNMNNVENTNKQ
jgi:hypothetical protein